MLTRFSLGGGRIRASHVNSVAPQESKGCVSLDGRTRATRRHWLQIQLGCLDIPIGVSVGICVRKSLYFGTAWGRATMKAVVAAWGCVHAAQAQGDCYPGSA